MSAKISGKVWELELDPTEKLVLLALSDHADHEGNNVRPGNDLLVAKTGLSQQTISAKITKFIEAGILEPVKDGRGRGVVREFSIEPDRAARKSYFIEREERKLQRERSYRKPESYKAGVSSSQDSYKDDVASTVERYNLGKQKVQSDNEKVQFDRNTYKEHEPSIEPSIESSTPSAQPEKLALEKSAKPANLFYESFRLAYESAYSCPYQNKTADFVQLVKCQKARGEWLTMDHWQAAVSNYFASELGNHTLADLSVRFGVFFRSALDRYGKPLTNTSTLSQFSAKTQSNVAAAQSYLAKRSLTLGDAK